MLCVIKVKANYNYCSFCGPNCFMIHVLYISFLSSSMEKKTVEKTHLLGAYLREFKLKKYSIQILLVNNFAHM